MPTENNLVADAITQPVSASISVVNAQPEHPGGHIEYLDGTDLGYNKNKLIRLLPSSPKKDLPINESQGLNGAAGAHFGKPDSGPVHVAPHHEDVQDIGWVRWCIILGGWCCLFCSFGWTNCLGVFQDYYQQHQLQNYSPSAVSWILSMEIFLIDFCGPVFGKIFDNSGTRYLLYSGSLIHVFGLTMASFSSDYYQFFLSQGLCSGVGASAVFYAAIGAVSTQTNRNRATAFGIMTSGSSLGAIAFSLIVPKLFPLIGFSWTMRVVALLISTLLVIATLTLRTKPTARSERRFQFCLQSFTRPLKEPPFVLLTAAILAFLFGNFVPYSFIISQAQKAGMSAKLRVYLVSILNGAGIFGRIVTGIVADRIGGFNMMIVTCLSSSILVLALWLPSHSDASIITFACLYGFSSGGYVSLAPALVAQVSDVAEVGTRSGTLFAITSIGALTGNPIAGALVSGDSGFIYLQLFCGVMLSLGTCLFVVLRVIQASDGREKFKG